MELNALTRWESLARDMFKLETRRPVPDIVGCRRQANELQFLADEFPELPDTPYVLQKVLFLKYRYCNQKSNISIS
jgi:hypothetical protein